MSLTLRILVGALLIAFVAAGWSSVSASAAPSVDVTATLLEIKDRAWRIQQLATQIASQTRDPRSRSLAMGVAYDARRLNDRAEKALRP